MFKSLLYIAILTTAVVISWIGFTVHHSHTTSTISPDTKIRITPIPPSFNKEVIERIKAKKVISTDLDEDRAIISITPEPRSSDESTNSGEIAL